MYIRKLSVHDVLSQMAVHVSMDMLVVIEDLSESTRQLLYIYTNSLINVCLIFTCTYSVTLYAVERLCREPHEIPGHVKVTNEQGEPISSLRCRRSISDVSEMQGQMSSERAATFQNQATPLRPLFKTPPMGARKQATKFKTQPSTALSDKQGTGQAVGRVATITRNSSIKKALTSYMRSSSDADGGVSFTESLEFLKLSITSNSASSVDSQSEFETLKEPSEVHHSDPPMSREEENLTAGAGASEDGGLGPLSNFRPLLLFIPLRLGQDSFNMEYAVALKVY